MIQKDGTIVINEWNEGIGESPHTGFGMMRNVDFHDPKGVLKIALAPTKISSTTVTDLITWFTKDTSIAETVYGGGYLDSKVYSITYAGVVSSIAGVSGRNKPGGKFWKDYLIVASQDSSSIELDAYDGSSWDLNFETTASSTNNGASMNCPMFSHPSESDSLYIGTGYQITKLQEDTTFDPSSGATYTFSASALDLPPDYSVESLTQLTSDLLIGASKVGGSHYQHSLFAGQIFPWDRSSASFSTPVSLSDGGVNQLINVNNSIYYINGEKGDYFITNGSIFQKIKGIAPLHSLAQGASGLFFSSAVETFKDEILFGISSDKTSFTPAGVYGYKDGAWRFLEISTGEIGENNDLLIGAIIKRDSEKDTFLVGWQDDQNSAYGIDEFGASGYRYTGYKAYVESPLYRVGSPRQNKSYSYIDFVLAKELSADQGIRISYRKNLTDDFTVIKTIDFDTYGAVSEASFNAGIMDVTTVQFKIELTTGASSTTTPELKEVIIM